MVEICKRCNGEGKVWCFFDGTLIFIHVFPPFCIRSVYLYGTAYLNAIIIPVCEGFVNSELCLNCKLFQGIFGCFA